MGSSPGMEGEARTETGLGGTGGTLTCPTCQCNSLSQDRSQKALDSLDSSEKSEQTVRTSGDNNVSHGDVEKFLVRYYAQQERERNTAIVQRTSLLTGIQTPLPGPPSLPILSSATNLRDYYVKEVARMDRYR